MKRIALFPGSFDPFTLGHKAVAERGLTLFDGVVIAVGVNTDKRGLLAIESRVQLIRRVFEGDDKVQVAVYDGITGEYCRTHGIRHILRGIRSASDFEYEHAMEMANTQMFPDITTVAVFTPSQYVSVSSRLVREIITMGGDPSIFLPQEIDIKDYI